MMKPDRCGARHMIRGSCRVRKTVIIADDLTGALDAAAPFASPSVSVEVTLGPAPIEGRPAVDVLSCCIETRHLDASRAYAAVRDAADAASCSGAQLLFKKTDSALRGNVGAELRALHDANESAPVHFIPAFPDAGRTTVNGIHLIDGTPVAESAFGSDPLNPVLRSRVADIVSAQSDLPVIEVPVADPVPRGFKGIIVYDAKTQRDIDVRVRHLLALGGTLAVAGSSGLSRALASAMGIEVSSAIEHAAGDLLVLCGSGNPASRAQCALARAVAPSIEVPLEAMIDPEWVEGAEARRFMRDVLRLSNLKGPLTLVDASAPVPASVGEELGLSSDDFRARISTQLGVLFACLVKDARPASAMVMGGDALAACLRSLGIEALAPFAEPVPGVVASRVSIGAHRMVLVSKSGGFGGARLFCELAERLSGSPPASRTAI